MNPLQELRDMEKTKENTISYLERYLPKIAFNFATTKGIPFDQFEAEMEKYSMLDQLNFIIRFYQKNNA